MIEIKFYKGEWNRFQYNKFHEPIGEVFKRLQDDFKKKRIYSTHRVLTTPFIIMRINSIPKMV